MPSPVIRRNTASISGDVAFEDASMPSPAMPTHSRMSGRRPKRSAQGAMNNEPIAIPTSPALSR
ncbi:hypothetical protein D3C84_1258270 [compost metagenome]